MNECFERVEMIVTFMPDPFMALKDWEEIQHAIVHCLAVESKEVPTCENV